MPYGRFGATVLPDPNPLRVLIDEEAAALGFTGLRISPAQIPPAARTAFQAWLAKNHHGSMDYLSRNTDLREHPEQLVPGARSVISVRLPYWHTTTHAQEQLDNPDAAYISRYALGRDYHKIIRNRLQTLAERLTTRLGAFTYRAFSDSAPVMEVTLATQAGLGWVGKHTLSLNKTGSWYFLGELICDLELPPDPPATAHCGSCTRCIGACPTGAITAPYTLDARRCISYLTIEYKGIIPEHFRRAIGNRIYGCDDCQLVCPWNRFSPDGDKAFTPRHNLDRATLLELFCWSEAAFLENFAGSPIRRIGYEQWERNLCIALGNSTPTESTLNALKNKRAQASALLLPHIDWALAQLTAPE